MPVIFYFLYYDTVLMCRKNKEQFKFSKSTIDLLLKGGYLDFSHLTELKNIYIAEI